MNARNFKSKIHFQNASGIRTKEVLESMKNVQIDVSEFEPKSEKLDTENLNRLLNQKIARIKFFKMLREEPKIEAICDVRMTWNVEKD